jgi:hypothetical protein
MNKIMAVPLRAADGCQWPLWGNSRPPRPLTFCGCRRALGPGGQRLPYCKTHAALACMAPRPRRPLPTEASAASVIATPA